jgi:Rod binding domain-containing protein
MTIASSGNLAAALNAGAVPSGNSHASGELAKLGKAAGEFEAMLLQSLWKSMKSSFSDPEDPNFDPTLENFDDLSMQALAGAVGNAGGLGIKEMILKYLGPQQAGSTSTPTVSARV